jgi:SP family general alpha glucoside:H+ symporter-like MFS transporter
MSLMEGIRTYPKAVGWSLLISSCIIMEGVLLPLFHELRLTCM